jgi:hypothetical protein
MVAAMFKHRTLFIVGAGASAELGLPVGGTLASKIAELLETRTSELVRDDGNELVHDVQMKHPLQNNGYIQAARAISAGVMFANSIDDYLDRHADNLPIQRVGRPAIVKCILKAEHESRLYRAIRGRAIGKLNDTWHLKFFRMLGARVNVPTAHQIFENIGFIVFNYDRCIEQFLIAALQDVYGMGQNEAVAAVDACGIIHPYGVIADLPYGKRGIPFGGGDDNYRWSYTEHSANIKIFTEQIASDDMLQRLRAKLLWAEQLVFLGFGYIDENIALIRPGKMQLKPVFGTAFDMSENSIGEVKEKLATFFNGGRQGILPAMQITNETCCDLFDHYAMRLPT